jgi:hypothetical protein
VEYTIGDSFDSGEEGGFSGDSFGSNGFFVGILDCHFDLVLLGLDGSSGKSSPHLLYPPVSQQ